MIIFSALWGGSASLWGGNIGYPGAATTLTVIGWIGDQMIDSVTITLSSDWVNTPGFDDLVSRLEFLPSGISGGYFRIGDLKLQYSDSSIPAPSILWLMLFGPAYLWLKKPKSQKR